MNKLERFTEEELQEIELAVEELDTDLLLNKYGLKYEDIRHFMYEEVK